MSWNTCHPFWRLQTFPFQTSLTFCPICSMHSTIRSWSWWYIVKANQNVDEGTRLKKRSSHCQQPSKRFGGSNPVIVLMWGVMTITPEFSLWYLISWWSKPCDSACSQFLIAGNCLKYYPPSAYGLRILQVLGSSPRDFSVQTPTALMKAKHFMGTLFILFCPHFKEYMKYPEVD